MALNVMQRRILQLNAEKAAKQAALDNQLADFQQQADLAKANAAISEACHSARTPVAEAVAEAIEPPVRQPAMLGKNQITVDMLNHKQRQAIDYGRSGKSFCLIGSAGTGKTTTQRLLILDLAESGKIGNITSATDSQVYFTGAPAVGVFSFTNKAVNNIRDALPEEYKAFCTTLHKVLEYHPIFEDVSTPNSRGGVDIKTIRKFIPRYGTNAKGDGLGMKLPHLDLVIVEEAGSIPTDLWENFLKALPNGDKTVFIFLGDLNQLPPVFGDAILGFSLLDLPIVELTEPYRAALESPITRLATKIKDGIPLSDAELKKFEELNDKGNGNIYINPFTPKARQLTPEVMCNSFGTYCFDWVMDGSFNPDESVILIPMNVNFGTKELNRWIGDALRVKNQLQCWHVIAGFESHYFCVGDRVLYNKSECEILGFEPNRSYNGVMPVMPSTGLNRWGRNTGNEMLQSTTRSIDEMLEIAAEQMGDSNGAAARQASHIITLRDLNTGEEVEAKTAGDVNSMLFTWALSIHKSQGSEWPHVIVVLHDSHKKMWKRELIYTAVTRARSKLSIYYSGERGQTRCSAFQIGVTRSEYKATSLEGKLNYFRAQRKKAELMRNMATVDPAVLARLTKPLIGDE